MALEISNPCMDDAWCIWAGEPSGFKHPLLGVLFTSSLLLCFTLVVLLSISAA